VVCAPILASLHTGPTDGKSQSGEERVTGDGWSVVLPAGWQEEASRDFARTSVRMFVSPQVGIAPVFFQIGAQARPTRGEADAREFLTAFFGSISGLITKPVRVGDADALEFRAQKTQPVDPAFALIRLVVTRGWRVGVLCIGAAAAERTICEAMIRSLKPAQ
jgi:hypothetical protein